MKGIKVEGKGQNKMKMEEAKENERKMKYIAMEKRSMERQRKLCALVERMWQVQCFLVALLWSVSRYWL